MHVAALYLYPVKSLRGFSIPQVTADRFGLQGDRRFLVVDAQSRRFLTQRALPQMARVATALTQSALILHAEDGRSIELPLEGSNGTSSGVTIWNDSVTAADCGDEAAEFLTRTLAHACRLVRVGPHFRRPVRTQTDHATSQEPSQNEVGFADAYPILVTSESSLADVNDRLAARGEDPVPMDRFRPNIVIADCPAFAEDTWPRFRIGDLILRSAGPCSRCPVVTTDQSTGVRGKEPLTTLAMYRRDANEPTKVNFGQNVLNESKSGTCRLGDSVALL